MRLTDVVASADQRYVAFTDNVTGNAASVNGFSFNPGGDIVLVADTLTGTVSVANHGNTATTVGYQAWGGGTARGFTADASSLVFTNAYLSYFNNGFTKSGDGDQAVMAYDLASGNQRLLSHSADATNKVQGAGASFQAMSLDGKWALFTANDATKFGNADTAFTDSNTTGADLFATDVKTGEIRLLSGVNGVSDGGANSFVGLSADGNIAYFTTGNVNGFEGLSGTLVDNNTSGNDLVGIRLNLLDLATGSDTGGGAAGTTYDNLTTATHLTINAQLGANQSALLYDGQTQIGSATANGSGVATWDLNGVALGVHHYTLVDAAEQIPIQLLGSVAASSLDVTVV